jgi:hypothetical protein
VRVAKARCFFIKSRVKKVKSRGYEDFGREMVRVRSKSEVNDHVPSPRETRFHRTYGTEGTERNGKWEMGNGKWEMGNGKWAMGDGRWAMGDGRWAMG